jgi:Protein kinase domain
MQSTLRRTKTLQFLLPRQPTRRRPPLCRAGTNDNAFWWARNLSTTSSAAAVTSNSTNQQAPPVAFLPWGVVGALALLAGGVTTYTSITSSDADYHHEPHSRHQANSSAITSSHHHLNTTTTLTPGAKNIMLHRMRSTRGRSLNDKYNIDWTVRLGEGAYGSVHPARLRATGEKVALKQINRGFTNAIGFKTETDALLRIYDNGGHPNINGLRDMYEDHKYYYLILDLVSGGEMFEHLVSQGAYSEADAARLMHEVASALAFLHGVGVVHCDLKPENLLLSTKNRLDGTIKMIDFGCAVLTADNNDDDPNNNGNDGTMSPITTTPLRPNRSSTGTTAYWSPERFPGKDDDDTKKSEVTGAVDMVRTTSACVEDDCVIFFLQWRLIILCWWLFVVSGGATMKSVNSQTLFLLFISIFS